jgi:4-hydroxy-tetrahydrodipicolinate synthase
MGADAVMVLFHLYIYPNDDEMYQHFETIATKSEMPVMLYNLARISGKDVSVKVIGRLVEGNHLNSAKESTRDFVHTTELVQVCGNKATVLKGHAEDFLPALRIGVKGNVTTASSCIPGIFVSIWDSYQKGEYEKGAELHHILMPLISMMRRANDVKMTKEALSLLGHPVGSPRRPLAPATKEEREELRRILSDLKLI